MRVKVAVALVVLLGAARGIYLLTNPGPSAPVSLTGESVTSAPSSRYLASGSDFAGFIQWSDELGHLNGSLRWVDISGTPPNEQVLSTSVPLEGSIEKTSISISFQGRPDSSATLSNGSFLIDVVWPDGIAAPLSFRSASVQSFSLAVGQLRMITNEADWFYKRALMFEQERQATKTLLDEKKVIDHDACSVESDIANLAENESSLQSNLARIVASSASEHHVKMQPTQQEGSVDESKAVVHVDNDIDAIRQGITTLASDFATFQSDESDLPNYVPPGAPTQQVVTNAEEKAEQTVAVAIATTGGTSP